MSVINQQTGRATITGYTYAYIDENEQEQFIVAEDDIEMAYVVLCRYETSVEEEPQTSFPVIRLKGMRSPSQPPIHFIIDANRSGAVQIEIYDLAGRQVRVYDPSDLEQGSHSFSWDGVDQRGRRVPAGLYWIHARLADSAGTKKLVVVR